MSGPCNVSRASDKALVLALNKFPFGEVPGRESNPGLPDGMPGSYPWAAVAQVNFASILYVIYVYIMLNLGHSCVLN